MYIIYYMISYLPVELQNNIFYYTAEHPCAKISKDCEFSPSNEQTGTCLYCNKHGRKLRFGEGMPKCKSCVCDDRLNKFEKTIRLKKFFNTWNIFCEQSIHEAVENGNAKDKYKEAFIGECVRCYDDKVVFKYSKGI